jgi:alpha/beta superfamily hydrolase
MPWRESAPDLARARDEKPIVAPSPNGRLTGVFTPPDPEVPPAGRCVVLFTRPRSHRNRMWVEAARRLAGRGFAACRFDYHGCGDSEGASTFLDPNRPYREDALAIVRHLRAEHDQSRFIVVGSCFDARTALSTFDGEAAALDGLVFIAAPVMELDTLVAAHADKKDWKHLARALGNPGNWRTLGDPKRWKHMATVVSRVARRSVATDGAADDTPLADSFVRHFRAFVDSRARALFLYGREDAEYASFEVAERTAFAKLAPEVRRRFEIEVWPGQVHGHLTIAGQRRTLERVLSWIADFPPAAAPHAAGRNGRAGGGD